MKSIDNARTKTEKLLNTARKDYEKTQDSIHEYEIKAKTAGDKMEEAMSKCDIDAYNNARDDKTKAEGAIEMYQERAKRLEEDPLVTEGEYLQMCADIEAEYQTYMSNLKAELYDLTEQMENLAQDARDTIKGANDALHGLQYDVYRGQDLEYTNDGKHVRSQTEKKVGSREDWGLVEWASRAGQGETYKAMKKDREA